MINFSILIFFDIQTRRKATKTLQATWICMLSNGSN